MVRVQNRVNRPGRGVGRELADGDVVLTRKLSRWPTVTGLEVSWD
jgi:hypothetical protein